VIIGHARDIVCSTQNKTKKQQGVWQRLVIEFVAATGGIATNLVRNDYKWWGKIKNFSLVHVFSSQGLGFMV
jgi:hypothetical protein